MRNLLTLTSVLFIGAIMFNACSEEEAIQPEDQVPSDVLEALENAGYDVFDQAPIFFEDGYLVEGDIYINSDELSSLMSGTRLPGEEQYSTNNLVSTGGSRTITIYAQVATSGGGGKGKKGGGGGGEGFSPAMIAGLDEAIARYNAENLELSFQRITSDNGDITLSRLKKGDERRGILGSAGFPTSSGDPYHEIKMSGILESTYGLDTDGIATIIAHEIGHCVGFRHTDYFNRSISCGGSAANEGTAGIGANHIPGTPADATLSDLSYMLSCTDGSNRPFNSDDQTALDYLY